MPFDTPGEVIDYVRREGVEMISLTNVDLFGRWKHLTIPADQLSESLFEYGVGLSLASYRGYKTLEKGDGRAVPDPSTAYLDRIPKMKTLRMLCDIKEPDGNQFQRDPRHIARKAEAYLQTAGLGRSLWLPELEFYLFDEVRFISETNRCLYYVDAEEAIWNGDREDKPNLGYKIGHRRGSQSMAPRDRLQDLRDLMTRRLEEIGVPVRYHHHESGGAGQVEIELNFQPLLRTADSILMAKYLIKNTAMETNKAATFMPKPMFGEPGSGMHLHVYLTNGEKSLFWDPSAYACLSDLARRFLAGILTHTPALMAFTNATTNSYKRLSPGQAVPLQLSFSSSNRTSAIRIPGYAINEMEQRIEYRVPDSASNPCLVLAAVLMAGLDGVQRGLDPEALGFGPFDFNLHRATSEQHSKMKPLPATLEAALTALAQDHGFLLVGDVFNSEFIDTWIKLKMEEEVIEVNQRPHPHEFTLYFDL